jgi:hypothetical protein
LFEGKTGVKFAEVEGRANGQLLAAEGGGRGGWPTIKYYNAATGAEGSFYKQKTSKRVCEELKERSYMQSYIEEMSGVTLDKEL